MLLTIRHIASALLLVSLAGAGAAYAATHAVVPVQVLNTSDTSDSTGPAAPGADTSPESDAPPAGEDDSKNKTTNTQRERSTEGCPEGLSGNHGKFVSGSAQRPRSDAAHSPCGKPVHEKPSKGGAGEDHAKAKQDRGAKAKTKPAPKDAR